METQKRTRGTFQSKPRQTASKTRANNLRVSCKYRVKKLFFLVCVIFGQKRGKLNARRNIYSEYKSYIEFFSQFARVYANFLVQYLFCQRKAFLLQEKCIRCLVVSKTQHWKTKTEARSTKHPKHPKHPNLEDEVPKTRKRSTQNSKPECPWKSRDSPLSSDQC